MKYRMICIWCVLAPSLAAGDAIVTQTVFDGPNFSIVARGASLLDDDATTIIDSWIRFVPTQYQLFGSGTWDGEVVSLAGMGCVVDAYPAACHANTPMTYDGQSLVVNGDAMNWSLVAEHNWQVPIGDANADGAFDSADLVTVFAVGEYEDNQICVVNDLGNTQCSWNENGQRNSDWVEGDWNLDQEFDSGDLVEAFVAGGYESVVVPEVVHAWPLLCLVLAVLDRRRTRR